MKRNKIILNIFLVFIALTAIAQQEADSVLVKVPLSAIRPKQPEVKISIAPDVIIKTNGNLFQCKIIEVNDAEVMYKLSVRDTSAALLNIPRGEVYAIAYANGLAMVITPELMGREAGMYPKSGCEAWDTFKENLGKGSLNVGIGFVSFYSPIKNSDSYEDEQVMPSVFAGYTFIIKEKLKAGVHLGIGGNELSKSGVSEYDQMKISSTVEEGFFCLGIFGRYDILDGAIKPFIKGGIDFIGVNMTTTSLAESLDGKTASLKTVVHQKGIKPGLILRAGLDMYLGDKFGIYGDVGSGLSLVQVGLLFNLE
jgi:opacity protein-like surface antigen